ncbi:MAG: hypothetical protein ACKVOR_10860 [Flavobacteriales bacterium]
MKAATLQELKHELSSLPQKDLVELCTRLVRYKKDNKELLTYLLFEADDENTYIHAVKNFVEEQFSQLQNHNLHSTTKVLRKILRVAGKHIRFTGSKKVESEILLHYCRCMRESGLPVHRSTALTNLYQRQIEKVSKASATLHEDFQFDIQQQLETLR